YYNLSNIYISLDERVLARNYLLNILKICKDKTSYLHALATQNVGYIYFLEGQYQQALTYYTQAMALAHKIDAKKLLSSTLIEMSEVYMELQDYKTAWTYQKQGYTLKDSVMNTKAMEEIMIQTNNFEQRQEKLEKQILTQNLLVNTLQNRNKTVLLIILFVLLAIFIVLLAWILKRLKVQQNNNKNLNNTLSTLEDNTKKEVLHSTQKLNEDIDFKNRELTSTSLLLIKANEMVGILKNEIKKLKVCKMEEATKEIVNEMESVLNTHNTDQNWQEFKLYFEQVHPNFFFSLTHLCPELSTSEQRTCALIFLNFSTKEIASITHRSPRTVETIMYQIRKKLNIPSEEKTLNFIQDILRKENTK
ncbi:MAG: tetratricopeptide repeat protein, partial [Bacteroidales bacterium]